MFDNKINLKMNVAYWDSLVKLHQHMQSTLVNDFKKIYHINLQYNIGEYVSIFRTCLFHLDYWVQLV